MTYPTADQVALAITAAAKEVSTETWAFISLAVIRRAFPKHPYHVTRTRAYAALALDEVFHCGSDSIGRIVRAGTKKSYLPELKRRIRRRNYCKWFDQAILDRVVAAVRAACGASDASEAVDVPVFIPNAPVRLLASDGPYVSADRPVPPKRVIEARNMLAEAVRNTAALPISE